MADETKKPEEIEFFFEFDPTYRIVAANGVWGGITPRGDIQLDFFVERQGVPEIIKHEFTEQGTLGNITDRKPEPRFIRRLQVGILLSPDKADSIANFIKEKVAEFNEKAAAISKGKSE